MICTHCGKELNSDARFCSTCGAPVAQNTVQPAANRSAAVQAAAPAVQVRRSFNEAPTWAKVISVAGFACALITLAFVWVQEMAPYTYGVAACGLLLCMIAMATKNRNVFSLTGMIMNICIVFIGSIQIASLVNQSSIWW